MSLTRQIAHNTIIQIVGKVITTAMALVAFGMMTRYLGTEKFGWYVTAISFLQFAGILIDFGLIPVSAQMLSEGHFEKKKLFQNLLAFRFFTALICLCIVPLIALFFPYPHEVKIAIAFTSLSFFAISINQVFTGFFQTELKMYLASFGEFIGRIVLVVGIAMLIFFGAGFYPIMEVITASSIVYTLVLLFFARKYVPIRFGFDLHIWKTIAIKMWPITLSIIFNVIYLKGDTILLSLYRSQQEVGMYGAAYRVIDILTQIAMLTMGILLPLLSSSWAKQNKSEFGEHYKRSVFLMLLLGMPLATGTLILANPLMRLIAGNEFAASGRPLQILSLAVFGLFFGAIYGHTAVALNKQRQAMMVYISAAILTLGGYLLFVPRYGMIGAAWMSVFSELFVGILLFIVIHRFVQVPLSKGPISKILLSTFCMGITLYFVQSLPVLLATAIGALIYGGMLVLTNAISKNTLKEILTFK